MNTFDFKSYLAEGGVDQQLLENEINLIFEEFFASITEEDLLVEEVTTEEKEQVNEGIGLVIAGAILSAPKIINLLGKLIKRIQKLLGKTPSEDGVAAWIEKQGKNLEGKYVKVLMKAIKLFGIAKNVWTDKKTGEVNEEKLEDTAEVILAIVLMVAGALAGVGGFEALESGSNIVAAIEGSLTGIKGAEILGIVKKVGPKLVSAAA
jgi:hypothetical protein